jgi:hypothetical protein
MIVIDEVAAFWNAFEKETGEKVEARSEGEWFHIPIRRRGLWGLLILTNKTFRFKYVPEDLRSSLYMSTAISGEPRDEAGFIISRSDIIAVHAPSRSFLSWVFRSAYPRSSVVAQVGKRSSTYVFAADPTNGLVAALVKSSAAK